MLTCVEISKEPIRSRSQVLIGRKIVWLRPGAAKQFREHFLALRRRQRLEPMDQLLHSLSHDLRLLQDDLESRLLLFPRPNYLLWSRPATPPGVHSRGPSSSRCVANECRNLCGPTRFVMLAFRAAWDIHTIGIPGQTTKDKDNRRIPFDPNGRLRGRPESTRNTWTETPRDEACEAWRPRRSHEAPRDRSAWARSSARRRLPVADGVDIRVIQLMLRHASVQQTQRHLDVTDEELRNDPEVNWKRRTLEAVAGGQNA